MIDDDNRYHVEEHDCDNHFAPLRTSDANTTSGSTR